jgi:hypothetical protein
MQGGARNINSKATASFYAKSRKKRPCAASIGVLRFNCQCLAGAAFDPARRFAAPISIIKK